MGGGSRIEARLAVLFNQREERSCAGRVSEDQVLHPCTEIGYPGSLAYEAFQTCPRVPGLRHGERVAVSSTQTVRAPREAAAVSIGGFCGRLKLMPDEFFHGQTTVE